MRRALSLLGLTILVFAVVAGAVALTVSRPEGGLGQGFSALGTLPLRSTVAVVPLEGEIERSDAFVETVKGLEDRTSVRAVVIRIDSPGGAVGPSQEMFAAVRHLAGVKPVVVSIGGMAASGGYYVAVGAKRIVANAGSLTGSIGVIMAVTDVSGLLDKLGVRATVLKAGALKDMGSPFRALTPEEHAILQVTLDQVHTQFIEAVASGRNLSVERTRELADGRLYSGQQAKEVGLVDDLGGLEDAVRIAGQEAGIENPRTEVIRPFRGPWWLRSLASESAFGLLPEALAAVLSPWLGRGGNALGGASARGIGAGESGVGSIEGLRSVAPESDLARLRLLARLPLLSRGLE